MRVGGERHTRAYLAVCLAHTLVVLVGVSGACVLVREYVFLAARRECRWVGVGLGNAE